MGGYERWGYENYLIALVDYPEAMRHYYHHTALQGRLFNQAIVLAREKYGIARSSMVARTSARPAPDCLPGDTARYLLSCAEMVHGPLVENGIGVIWHCDGDISPILSDIMDLAWSGYRDSRKNTGSTTTRW